MSRASDTREQRRDLQRLIGVILNTPMRTGEVESFDGSKDLKTMLNKNVDVRTRILMRWAVGAMEGDLKMGEALFKYGGLDPVKQEALSVELPTFVDDVPLIQVEGKVIEPGALPAADADDFRRRLEAAEARDAD